MILSLLGLAGGRGGGVLAAPGGGRRWGVWGGEEPLAQRLDCRCAKEIKLYPDGRVPYGSAFPTLKDVWRVLI